MPDRLAQWLAVVAAIIGGIAGPVAFFIGHDPTVFTFGGMSLGIWLSAGAIWLTDPESWIDLS